MPECDCGNEITEKNSADHWRESCQECISDVAERTEHVLKCDDDACRVCASKLEEIRSVMEPIYLRTLLDAPQARENETLDTYE